ncbi:MAG: oxidase assembly protein [Actinobacteria bacterium]|nr:oxidase assembly protein [Actinomycetota bacterium]
MAATLPQRATRVGRVLVRALLFAQCAIVVTGGAVRLTKSGLGCPTWPECAPGSFLPSPHQAEDRLNIWIEFVNRLLTFALFAIAVAVVIWVLRSRRRDLRLLAALQVLGIIGQAVVGGITVLTKLHPAAVGSHFILSIALIAGAVALVERAKGYPHRGLVAPVARNMIRALLLLGLLVIMMGIVVTGSGPHAGDLAAPRFGFDIRTVAWLHADLVIAFVGLLLAYILLLHFATVVVAPDPELSQKRKVESKRLLAITLGQGAIGYIQYFTGVPEVLVLAHLIGVVLLWSTLVRHGVRAEVFAMRAKAGRVAPGAQLTR